MGNRDLTAAWTYHDGTAHTPQTVRAGARGLDWANQPLPYKVYATVPPIPLPQDLALPALPALEAIAAAGGPAADGIGASRLPDLRALAGVLFLAAGITKRLVRPHGPVEFRAAACTGALYHIELYLICGDLPGLPAGIYHFGAHDFALRRLRDGDHRAAVAAATGGEEAIAAAPGIVACTTTFWRNAWKYRARAYRHAFWDGGTILANLLAAAEGYGLPARVIGGFVDDAVNRLLGLDTHREVTVALVALGWDGGAASTPTPEVEALSLPTVPLSNAEVDYPAIGTMHVASSLGSAEEVRAWRGAAAEGGAVGGEAAAQRGAARAQGGEAQEEGAARERGAGAAAGATIPLDPLPGSALPPDPIGRVVVRRGSSRRFARRPISFAQLSTMLDRATREIPADFLQAPGEALTDLYLIAHAVDGLPAGAYAFSREARALEPLRSGSFREHAGYLALEQDLAADASANVYLLADLPPILDRLGNRGYRAAQLEAAMTGGRLYLAAYALRLGATGLTFYDDEVTAFFSPHAAGKSVMFLTALGVPARRRGRT